VAHICVVFTKNPEEMEGEFVRTKLVKGPHGLGFTIIGGDQPDMTFLQIKDVVPLGPAYHDGSLETGTSLVTLFANMYLTIILNVSFRKFLVGAGDVLVNVNGVNVLGFAHQDILQLFQSMPVGQSVSLEVCRGYPLPFDPNDPDTEIVTTVAVKQREDSSPGVHVVANSPPIPYTMLPQQSTASAITPNKNAARSMPDLTESAMSSMQSPTTNGSRDAGPPQFLCISIMKGPQGFGFTIADSLYGQRVRQIIDRPRCKNLMEGDLLLEINRIGVKDMPHAQVVQLLKNCLHDIEASVLVQRGGIPPASRQITSPVSNYNGSAAVEV
jgi:atrophin-1 interacting protein 3 (BAI1-associated protein 1)